MAVKLIYIQNYPICKLLLVSLDTQLNESANQNSIKVPKVARPRNNKTWVTSVINSPMSLPPLLGISNPYETHFGC